MIRAIVIDDEKPSREVICNYLREYCNDVQVITTASSVKTGYKAIKKVNPDLVFLDIELGQGTGFDLLKMFDKITFKVIFVTAFSEHAIRAFRVNAIDYLLKPIKIDELIYAVEKVNETNKVSSDIEKITSMLKSLVDRPILDPTIVIPHLKGFEVLKICDIIMCKADSYCTNFFLTDKRKLTSSKNLKNFEKLLSQHNFVRVHHSYLVNLNHIISVNNQGEIILTSDTKAYLGDSYKPHLVHKLRERN